MEKLDRMELADIGHPRLMAEAVIKQIPAIAYPLPIEEVALALNIARIEDIDTDAFEGALLADDTKSSCAILLKAGVIETRRRFTIGHELGHALMPLHFPSAGRFQCTKSDMRGNDSSGLKGRPLWEAQANEFSSELLMPRNEFKRRLRAKRGASIEALVELSDEFGVSKTAAGRRLISLSDDPTSMIIARHGKIEQVYRGADFPFLSVARGHSLPRGATALAIVNAQDADVSEADEADPHDWMARPPKDMELFEQTLFQAKGWTLTLLMAEIPDEDD